MNHFIYLCLARVGVGGLHHFLQLLGEFGVADRFADLNRLLVLQFLVYFGLDAGHYASFLGILVQRLRLGAGRTDRGLTAAVLL